MRTRAAFVGTVIVAAIAMIVAMIMGGAARPLALLDPGPLVRWGLPVLQLAVNGASAIAIGGLVFACFALPFTGAAFARTMALVTGASGVWTLSALGALIASYLSLDPDSASDTATLGAKLWLYVTQVQLGTSWLAIVLFAAVTTTLAAAVRSRPGVALAAVVALAGQVPLALSGHASGLSGHSQAVGSLMLHLWGASIWIGGLVALLAVSRQLEGMLAAVVARYSTIALWGFVAVAYSGVINSVVRIGGVAGIFTPYGAIVLAKVVALTVLGAFGVFYRRRIIARMAASGGTRALFLRVAAVELLVMGVASGLAVALSRTPTPVPEVVQQVTPAQILTGEPLPPELTFSRWFTEWSIDPVWLFLGVVAIVMYLAGARRLRLRGDRWPVHRSILWVTGCLILIYVTCGAPNVYQTYLFSVHMEAHMVLTMVIPLFLVPGAPVTLLARAVAVRHDGSWGAREWVLWAVHTPYARTIASPVVAAAIFALSLWFFYYTPVFGWAVREHLGHQWMTVHFLISGYLFVQAIVGIDPGPRRPSYPVRLLLLLATMGFHAFFGVGIMMSTGLMEASWFGAMGRTWGAPPLLDQQNGGAIAWGIGEFPTVVLAMIVTFLWARNDQRVQVRVDRNADRTDDAELAEYNARLARLAERDRTESSSGR